MSETRRSQSNHERIDNSGKLHLFFSIHDSLNLYHCYSDPYALGLELAIRLLLIIEISEQGMFIAAWDSVVDGDGGDLLYCFGLKRINTEEL